MGGRSSFSFHPYLLTTQQREESLRDTYLLFESLIGWLDIRQQGCYETPTLLNALNNSVREKKD